MPADAERDMAVLRGLFTAQEQGRITDMLACIHPSMVWESTDAVPREHYLGRDGTLALFADSQRVFGPHHTRVDRLTPLTHGQYLLAGTLIGRTADGEVPLRSFEAVVTMRDGLLVRFADADSEPPTR